ncbi:MAG: hypothetical protein CMJ76_14935 [Planctomycetaceae bacterium]|nr:hypothetical protein [Planctomycetaceae bacterium]|tara:strand:- start:1860 stop:3119 length:1260 start_codon:yes stop_codon:yes gene_type:complete
MAIDTPATILFIGGGPVGLEAALYARYLGYQAKIYEAGQVCEHVHQWGHVKMFSPFSMNHSPLGKAAIESHEPTHDFPGSDEYLTGQQWIQSYLRPLSETDLLRPNIYTNCRVISVSRTWLNKTDLDQGRANDPFRVIIEQDNHRRVQTADVVIDTSGVFSSPNPIGAGGVPAIGEQKLDFAINRRIPTRELAQQLRGKDVAVVGAGHSAACALVTLTDVGANVTWITRGEYSSALQQIKDDPLTERVHIMNKVQKLVQDSQIKALPNCAIDTVRESGSSTGPQYQLGIHQVDNQASDSKDEHHLQLSWHSFDQIYGLTGYRVDNSIHQELQFHPCYATEGPIKLAASLLNQIGDNCLDVSLESGDLLITSEPNYYQLGIKSYGRQSGFLFRTGLQQIVQLFQLIGARDSLDIYHTFSG